MTVRELKEEAEVAASVFKDIIRQYCDAAKNSSKMISNFKKEFEGTEFGVVSCIVVGDDVYMSSAFGTKNDMLKCLDVLEQQINSKESEREE